MVVGGALGGGAAYYLAKDEEDAGKKILITAAGVTTGAILGRILGRQAAKPQIYAYRRIRLNNEQISELLDGARTYNALIEEYILQFEKEIADLEVLSQTRKQQIARAKRTIAEKQRHAIRAEVVERREISRKLSDGQQQKIYLQVLNRLEDKERALDASIHKLKKIEPVQARIGS
jgi:hypothetical protein